MQQRVQYINAANNPIIQLEKRVSHTSNGTLIKFKEYEVISNNKEEIESLARHFEILNITCMFGST
jgi:hypothetical protein